MKFKIGIIGATGFIGTPYREEIRNSPRDAEIVALCARRRDRLEAAAQQDGARVVTDEWQEVINHPDVNLVLVLTPDALHYQPVMACAAAGKHVLCEKPVGADVQQAHDMWCAFRNRDLGHFVPLWTRFVDVFVRGRDIIRSGLLGEIKAVVYRWHNPRPAAMPFTWRDDSSLSSAGTIADVGTHAYDTVRWMIGEEAERVSAHAGVITPPKPDLGSIDLQEALAWANAHSSDRAPASRSSTTFDYANLSVKFKSGAVGVFVLSHATHLRKGFTPELELHGTKASIGIDRVNRKITLARPDHEVEVLHQFSEEPSVNRFTQYVFPGLRARIAGDAREYPGLDDGWRSQIFTDAAVLSVKRNAWVELAELDAERNLNRE